MDRVIFGERQLAIAALVYAWTALICWPAAYTHILTYYLAVYIVFVPPIGLLALLAASLLHRPFGPVRFSRDLLARRGIPSLVTLIISCAGVAAFSTYKSQIQVPFFADQFLADLDEILHMGQPWRALHAIAPPELSWLLAVAYGPAWLLECILVILLAAFAVTESDRRRYFTCLAASMLFLGTLFRILASSAGPIFYNQIFNSRRFEDLSVTLSSAEYGKAVLRVANYLYEAHISAAPKFGAGISAMPSMHVALAVLNALFLARLGTLGSLLGWTYAALILLGSVYFGWHYAVDGYVSALCVVVGWALFGRKAQVPRRTSQKAIGSLP